MPDSVAVIVVVPVAVPAVTRPFELVTLLKIATPVLDEVHVTKSVRISGAMLGVAPEKKAVAVNCVEVSTLISASTGAIVRSVTLTVTLAVIDGWAISVAVITAIPSLTAETRPLLLTVATAGSDDCHVTWVQNIKFMPSEKWAVTNSCCAVSLARYGSAGVTVIDVIVFDFPQPLKPAAARDSSDMIRAKAIEVRFIDKISLTPATTARANVRPCPRCSLKEA